MVFQEGALGTDFYIVINGQLDFHAGSTSSKDSKYLKSVTKGDIFGEVALIDLAPRTSTVSAVKRTELWALSSTTYKKVNTRANKNYYAENTTFIESIPLFHKLS